MYFSDFPDSSNSVLKISTTLHTISAHQHTLRGEICPYTMTAPKVIYICMIPTGIAATTDNRCSISFILP